MAAEGGGEGGGAALRSGLAPAAARPATLAEALERELDRFEPFTALRLLGLGGDDPGAEPEVRGRASNRYAATPLAREARGPRAVEAAFVGLVGTLGPLPHSYTEAVLREEKRRSGALRGFLDVFVRRRASLFVRAHEKYRLPAAMARRGADGSDAVAGARTPDATSTFRVVVGPVDYASFMALEPRGRRMAELVELVRLYMDPGLDFDVQVVLRREDVPEGRLGPGAPRLGWNGWVRQTPMGRMRGRRCMSRVKGAMD